jgi:hypothetical protein
MSIQTPPVVKYKSGYKYQLVNTFRVKTLIKGYEVDEDYIKIYGNGSLYIQKLYAWDGPSGPTYDSKNSIRASLVHDVLYQCMRMKVLPEELREKVDLELNRILKEDGMWAIRRWYWLRGVRWFAGGAADPENAKEVLEAP